MITYLPAMLFLMPITPSIQQRLNVREAQVAFMEAQRQADEQFGVRQKGKALDEAVATMLKEAGCTLATCDIRSDLSLVHKLQK